MQSLTADLASAILTDSSPHLSLFQPTHRRSENQQDPIRFRTLVDQLENSLRRGYSDPQVETFLQRYRELGGSSQFWNETLDSIAVLGAPVLLVVLFPQSRGGGQGWL